MVCQIFIWVGLICMDIVSLLNHYLLPGGVLVFAFLIMYLFIV